MGVGEELVLGGGVGGVAERGSSWDGDSSQSKEVKGMMRRG